MVDGSQLCASLISHEHENKCHHQNQNDLHLVSLHSLLFQEGHHCWAVGSLYSLWCFVVSLGLSRIQTSSFCWYIGLSYALKMFPSRLWLLSNVEWMRWTNWKIYSPCNPVFMPPPKSPAWDHFIPGTKQNGRHVCAYFYEQMTQNWRWHLSMEEAQLMSFLQKRNYIRRGYQMMEKIEGSGDDFEDW